MTKNEIRAKIKEILNKDPIFKNAKIEINFTDKKTNNKQKQTILLNKTYSL